MCRPFSCIITKNQTVYSHPNPLIHSHTDIMKHYNLKESSTDPRFNSFVKIETYPKNNKSLLTIPIDECDIIIDEDYIPSWYVNDKDSFETIIRKAAISWLNRLKEIDWSKATPKDCHVYANEILKGRFALGEEIIASNNYYSYLYALYILKGPFPLGEKIIAKDAEYSYLYANCVLRKRFPLGEAAIATNAQFSYNYAKDVLKGPFALGEPAIATDAYYSYQYAMYVLKGPFPLGEEIIATDVHYSYNYAKDVLKGPFPLGEKVITTDGTYSFYYARDVLKGPFPLGEKEIKDSESQEEY